MKKLINKIYNIFSQKSDDQLNYICCNSFGDLNGYCLLEYTYIKKRSN